MVYTIEAVQLEVITKKKLPPENNCFVFAIRMCTCRITSQKLERDFQWARSDYQCLLFGFFKCKNKEQ